MNKMHELRYKLFDDVYNDLNKAIDGKIRWSFYSFSMERVSIFSNIIVSTKDEIEGNHE